MNLITSLPSWAVTDEAQAWMLGLGAASIVRLFRAALRWFNRVGAEGISYGD
jgi:hypothetical protein